MNSNDIKLKYKSPQKKAWGMAITSPMLYNVQWHHFLTAGLVGVQFCIYNSLELCWKKIYFLTFVQIFSSSNKVNSTSNLVNLHINITAAAQVQVRG